MRRGAAVAVVAAAVAATAVQGSGNAADVFPRARPQRPGRGRGHLRGAAPAGVGMTQGVRTTVCTKARDVQLEARGIPQVRGAGASAGARGGCASAARLSMLSNRVCTCLV